jgi:hypothetical protein
MIFPEQTQMSRLMCGLHGNSPVVCSSGCRNCQDSSRLHTSSMHMHGTAPNHLGVYPPNHTALSVRANSKEKPGVFRFAQAFPFSRLPATGHLSRSRIYQRTRTTSRLRARQPLRQHLALHPSEYLVIGSPPAISNGKHGLGG